MTDQPLKARFFVTRPDNTMVPLIALDELPDHVTVHGIPKILTVQDLTGLTCVGSFETRNQKHVINIKEERDTESEMVIESASSTRRSSTNDSGSSTILSGHTISPVQNSFEGTYAPNSSNGIPPETTPSTSRNISDESEGAVSSTESPVDKKNDMKEAPQSVPASSIDYELIPGVKKWCSYWLRTGCCDFAQQGCMFKHDMPLDLAGLEALGLNDIPLWYRQKYQLGSFRAVNGAAASFSGPNLKSKAASYLLGTHPSQMKSWRHTGNNHSTSTRGGRTKPRSTISQDIQHEQNVSARRSTMSQDVRLEENPALPVVRTSNINGQSKQKGDLYIPPKPPVPSKSVQLQSRRIQPIVSIPATAPAPAVTPSASEEKVGPASKNTVPIPTPRSINGHSHASFPVRPHHNSGNHTNSSNSSRGGRGYRGKGRGGRSARPYNKRARRESTASSYDSDIENEYLRQDAIRKRKEDADAEYMLMLERQKKADEAADAHAARRINEEQSGH